MLSGASSGPGTERRDVAPIIAVIEDDEDAGTQLSRALRTSGYRAFLHIDALDALRAMQHGPKPDLILLDLLMPGMDGWSFRVEQRSSPQLKDIPVIVMSGDASAKAAAIDADAYVQKPCPMERLRPLIERVLSTAERRRLLARGVELERLRSLGMLVSSVAHEVNNPLVYVGGSLELAARECHRLRQHPEEYPEVASALERHLAAAQQGADRIAGIVRSLLTFARPETEMERADIGRSVEAAINLALPSLRQKAKVVNHCGQLPHVRGSEAKLGQVFLNLLINAAQAIAHGSPERELVEVRGRVEGERVIIEVADTGLGIAADNMPQVFEPFFTTRAHEGGTGLGLSISREILESYGGTIGVQSEEGHGTTVRVELPVASGKVIELRREPASPSVAAPPSPARILVVDDEKMVCTFIRNALSQHEVHTYTDPQRALAELDDQPIDLVLSDYLMPALTGAEFYRELCQKRPELASRFVLMTGAAASDELTRLETVLRKPVLRKPFSPQALEELAQAAISERMVRVP
jgi:signal transduction histidine kinase